MADVGSTPTVPFTGHPVFVVTWLGDVISLTPPASFPEGQRERMKTLLPINEFSVRLSRTLDRRGMIYQEDLFDAVERGESIRGIGSQSLKELNEYLPVKIKISKSTGRMSFENRKDYERFKIIKDVTEIKETDPAIIGAKKAYDFIFAKTNDEKTAAKAFNSYLLGRSERES